MPNFPIKENEPLAISTSANSDLLTKVDTSRKASKQKCLCQCHRPVRVTTPSRMRDMMGDATLSLTSIPLLWRRHCDYSLCTHACRGGGDVSFRFLLPAWLAFLGIEWVTSWRPVIGASGTWSLRFPRRFGDTSLVLRLHHTLLHGSVTEFLQWMDKYGVRPFDIVEGHKPFALAIVSTHSIET
jgi:hypothetical protein